MLTVHRNAREPPRDRTQRLSRLCALALPAMDQAAVAGVQLYLLGLPRLQPLPTVAPGSDPVAPGAHALERKDAALLALLAVDGPASRARLAALLWPDVDDDKARNNLRQRLFRLRRLAGRDIVAGEAVLRLADGVVHDLLQLAERVGDDPDAGGGELLGPHDYEDAAELADWVGAAREHWHAARRHALADVAARHESEGRIAAALPYAERLVQADPLREHAHRRVMRLHYLRGDRAAALAAYERLRELLRRELGTAPDRESRELAQLVEASGALPQPAPAARPVAVLRPPRLVGRDAEWAALDAARAAGRHAVVIGEPGIGKSRLLGDFVAARGGLVFGARPGDARMPYALLARVIRGTVQEHGRPSEPWVMQEFARIAPEFGTATGKLEALRLRHAVVAALGEWHGAGLAWLGVDDLQFADEATLELLPSLAASGPALGWICGVRASEMPAAVAQWLDARDDCVERIVLGPLDVAAIGALLDSLALPGIEAARWAPPLARHTGGNPLFILETLRAVLERGAAASGELKLPAPRQVGALIEQRLEQLSPTALRLARVAAIAGQDFSVELAATVLQSHVLDLADAWRELESAQIIRDNAFAHDLIFEATQRTVPAAIARSLHREIARWLQAHGGAAAAIARHAAEAGEWLLAAQTGLEAAGQARRASRRGEEVALLHQAADCYERCGEPERAFEVRADSVEAVLLVKGVDTATALADRLLRDATSEAQRATALARRALARLMGADHGRGVEAANEAIAIAERLGLPWVRFDASRLLAIGLSQREQADAALAVLEPFRDLVEREGSAEQWGNFLADYAYVLNSARRLRRTAEVLQKAIAHARTLDDTAQVATMTSNLALVHGNLGQPEAALASILQSRALQQRLGETAGPPGAAIDMYVGMYQAAIGRYGEALASFDAAIDVFGRDPASSWNAVARNHKFNALLDLRQLARARQVLDYAEPTIDSVRARGAMLVGRLEAALGRPARPHVERALAILGPCGDVFIRMLALLEAALLLPPAQGAAECAAVEQMADGIEYLGIALKARLLRVRALLDVGDVARAIELLPEHDARFRGVNPADLYYGSVFLVSHLAWRAAGDGAAARRALEEGVAWVRQQALPNVPPPFRDSFLERNPVNRALLTAATRHATP